MPNEPLPRVPAPPDRDVHAVYVAPGSTGDLARGRRVTCA
jgi:hypothetical protein